MTHSGRQSHAFTKDGLTPLIVVSHTGVKDIVSLLLAAGAEKEAKEGARSTRMLGCRRVVARRPFRPSLTLPQDGNTALIMACFENHTDIISMLIEAGADVSAVNEVRHDLHSRLILRCIS